MSLLRLLALFLLLAPALAQGLRYGAEYEHSRWESRREGDACLLSQTIPRFGEAEFSQNAEGRLGLVIYAERPPLEFGRALIYSRGPEWNPETGRRIYAARILPERRLMKISHFDAQRLLVELERGREAVIQLEGWWSREPIEITLSPVHFRAGLLDHFRCVAGLRGPEPMASGEPAAHVATGGPPVWPAAAGP